uniref:Putative aldo-keto reductase 2 n=1 Tax=Papilio dardanus TaxID=77259 RepID=B8ZX08_PAPDA|nr:putative aldo-keto reductase 2 [Papilio dardanus]
MQSVLCDNTDGGKAPRILLNDGHTMPVFGLGTFLGFDELGLNEQRHVLDALRASLARLNTSYVDLYLIHNPVALKPDHSGFDVIDYVDTWRSMEEVKALGLAKSIGISNFNISQIDRLLKNCHIKPAVLQVEVNLNLAQDKLIEHVKKENIAVMAYTPFGRLFSNRPEPPPPRKDHPVLLEMANKYNKTTPQIVLRYLVQRGVIPVPKTVHKERVEENIDIFDFELTPEEMELLDDKYSFDTRYNILSVVNDISQRATE